MPPDTDRNRTGITFIGLSTGPVGQRFRKILEDALNRVDEQTQVRSGYPYERRDNDRADTNEEEQMINIHSSTLIYRPIKRVFDFISTPENDFQWQYGTLASARTSEGAAKLGTAFRSVGHMMGYRAQSTYEVTEFEPNIKYGFKSLSGPLQTFTSFTLTPTKGCTQVEISVQANAVNLVDITENILQKRMKKQIKEDLALLKNILEAK